MQKHSSFIILLSACVVSAGLVLGGFLLGSQAKLIGSSGTIRVKGLAEKSIVSDSAQWDITIKSTGTTYAEALANLRKENIRTESFIKKLGYKEEQVSIFAEVVEPTYRSENQNGTYIDILTGYAGNQLVTIRSDDLPHIQKSYSSALEYKAAGGNIDIHSPQYLVSNLEELKMSLIDAATENAYTRAGEFTKHGKAKLSSMRSASQGAFFILSNSADTDYSDYGGTYNKATVNKVARVVVTVEFNLE